MGPIGDLVSNLPYDGHAGPNGDFLNILYLYRGEKSRDVYNITVYF